MTRLETYLCDRSGATSVEAAVISGVMVALTVTIFEIGYGFHQWNTAQQATRIGARIAATTAPVSLDLSTMTGLGAGVEAGDPMPDYVRTCMGTTSQCSSGGFNTDAMTEIVFGPDSDGICATTSRERRGMCDLMTQIGPSNLTIAYSSSGMGRAGQPASLAPLVTVTLSDLEFSMPIIGSFTPLAIRQMPDISVTVMAEDLRSGAS